PLRGRLTRNLIYSTKPELTLQHIKKYIKVKIQEKNTLLFLIFCKVRSKGSLTSKISLVVGLFVA
ncbi:TPA: hypothetical protein ACXHUI_005885, partial [Klebsiella pneumoniae]